MLALSALLAAILLVALVADGADERLLQKHYGGVADRMRLMTCDTLKRHIAVVWVVVESPRACLRLPAICVTLEASAVAQGET